MIHEDFRTYLLTITAVSTFVDSVHIYPQETPEGIDDETSRILYEELGGDRTRSLGGYSNQQSVDFSLRIQSRSYTDAKTVAAAIVTALDCFIGTMGSTTVQGAFVERDSDSPVIPPKDGSEQGLREVVLPVRLWISDTCAMRN